MKRKNIFESIIQQTSNSKNLKSQTIHLLTHKNLIQKKLEISFTITYENILVFDKTIKNKVEHILNKNI